MLRDLKRKVRRFAIRPRARLLIQRRTARLEAVSRMSREEVLELLRGSSRVTTSEYGVRKGAPDLATAKQVATDEICRRLTDHPLPSGDGRPALARALLSLPALDVFDANAFDALIGGFNVAYRPVLEDLRSSCRRYVVLHLSCHDRLQRAAASTASFEGSASLDVAQITVVGAGPDGDYQFEPRSGLLVVPASDDYASLPEKLAAAMFFLALAGTASAVLKLDDDHRLRSAAELLGLFDRARRASGPRMYGKVMQAWTYGFHSRSWHFGKCAGSPFEGRPHSTLGAVEWVGGDGYVLNRPALNTILWSYVYFRDEIRCGLYEDMTLSNLVLQLGGEFSQHDMSRVLTTTTDY